MSDSHLYVKIIATAIFVVVMVCMVCSNFFDDDDYQH
jgi:hypothetical protein